MSFSEVVTKEVVATLDSSILQFAKVREIRHFTIGDRIEDRANARGIRVDVKQDTALHKAAEHAGRELAERRTGVAIIVSDLDLDVPDADLRQRYACPGVPMPAQPRAGAIFGGCFAAGLAAGKLANLPDILVSAFMLQPRTSPPQSNRRATARPTGFFVLLLARDISLGRAVTALMKERWTPLNAKEIQLVDTRRATEALQAPVSCSWRNDSLYEIIRSRNAGGPDQCFFLCTDTDGRGRVSFALKALSTESGVLRMQARNVSARGAEAKLEGGALTMVLNCPAKPRRAYTTVSATAQYAWLRPNASLPGEENARDLLASLLAVLPDIVQPRSVTFAIQQR